MRLLVTRPLPNAERTAVALRERGHTVTIAALLEIEPVTNAEIGPGPWTAILLTSANAAYAMSLHEKRETLVAVPVFAVGERSAHAMRHAGFTSVTSADGDVSNLADLIEGARLKPLARLLYLAGAERSGDLAGDLRTRGFAVDTVVVYRALTAERLPAEAMDALSAGIDGVLHYSRRSAEAYINAARNSDLLAPALGAVHFCLSAQVALPLAAAGAARIRIAPRPNEAALFELIGANPP